MMNEFDTFEDIEKREASQTVNRPGMRRSVSRPKCWEGGKARDQDDSPPEVIGNYIKGTQILNQNQVEDGYATYSYDDGMKDRPVLKICGSKGRVLAKYDVRAVDAMVKVIFGGNMPVVLEEFLEWATLNCSENREL